MPPRPTVISSKTLIASPHSVCLHFSLCSRVRCCRSMGKDPYLQCRHYRQRVCKDKPSFSSTCTKERAKIHFSSAFTCQTNYVNNEWRFSLVQRFVHKSFLIRGLESSALEIVLIRKFWVSASLEPSEHPTVLWANSQLMCTNY